MTGSESEAPDRPLLEGNRTNSRTPSPSFVNFNRNNSREGLGAGNRSPWLRGGGPNSSASPSKLAPVGNSVSSPRRARGGKYPKQKQQQKMGIVPFISGTLHQVPKRLQPRFLQEQPTAQYSA